MAKRKRRRPAAPEQVPSSPVRRSADAREWLLAAAVGLFVARPLVPPEAIEQAAAALTFSIGWLVLAIAWPLAGWLRAARPVRFCLTDWAVVALMAAFTLSGLSAVVYGAPRPAINATWQWITAGVSFLLIRRLVRSPREARAVTAVMIGLAVGLSVYGIYQYFVELPAMRQAYLDNPAEVLTAEGIEPGSTAQRRLEDRINSTEPFATFSLTNSLAGFLVPWLTVLVGLAFAGMGAGDVDGTRKNRYTAAAIALGCALPVVACLVLTKSRSGYLAAGAGMVLAVIFFRAELVRTKRSRIINWGAVAAPIAVVVVTLITIGGIDLEVLTESSKSLAYRVQYWQSSLAMIADYPLLGCGPGNFQDTYTQYKLPQAAEEVADPHNFLLEIWAVGGTLAMLAFLFVVGSFVRDLLRRRAGRKSAATAGLSNSANISAGNTAGQAISGTRAKHTSAASPDTSTESPYLIFAGAMAGVLGSAPLCLLSISGIKTAAIVIVLITMAGVLAALYRWILHGRFPTALPAIGAAALLVHLLASGGIGIPAVAGSLWLLMGLAIFAEPAAGGEQATDRRPNAAATVIAVLLALACFLTAYRPVMTSRAEAALARQARSNTQIESHLLAAAEADSLAAAPQRALAGWCFQRWQQEPNEDLFQRFAAANERGLQLSPRASAAWRQSGRWYRTAYESSKTQGYIEQAADAYRRAVQLYPHNATLRGQFAVTLEMAGQTAEAQTQAREALRIDRLTPHEDQKLPGELRGRLERIVDTAP